MATTNENKAVRVELIQASDKVFTGLWGAEEAICELLRKADLNAAGADAQGFKDAADKIYGLIKEVRATFDKAVKAVDGK